MPRAERPVVDAARLDLRADVYQWAARAARGTTGDLIRVEPLSGAVSRVYRLRGSSATAVLKVRGTTYARLPSIATPAGAAAAEQAALELFSAALPDVFPRVLATDPGLGALLMTDLGPDSPSLGERWGEGRCSRAELVLVGGTVGRLHVALSAWDRPLRPDGDQGVRTNLLGYCLRDFGVDALWRAERTCMQERPQLVHGDLAPKNMILRDTGLGLVDVEFAHVGSPTFELAYVVAHAILLLAAETPAAMTEELVGALIGAYTDTGAPGRAHTPEFVACIIGVLLYRMTNRLIADPVPWRAGCGEQVAERLRRLLRQGSYSLADVCSALEAELHPVVTSVPGEGPGYWGAESGPVLVAGPDRLRHLPQAELIARDQNAFAIRLRPWTARPSPGLTFSMQTVELGDGDFTNWMRIAVDTGMLEIDVASSPDGFFLPDVVGPGVVAAVSGSFAFISDDPSYWPSEPCLDLCGREGTIVSLPTADKPAFLVYRGRPLLRLIRARGSLRIGERRFGWVGSKVAWDGHALSEETLAVHGAANSVIEYGPHERTGFVRFVRRHLNVTPVRPDVVDLLVGVGPGGTVVQEVVPGGGVDLFKGSFVLRGTAEALAGAEPGDQVEVLTMDGLDATRISSATSVGPSVWDAVAGHLDGYDACLGTSPFHPDRRFARTLVSQDDGGLSFHVLDGAPLTDHFQGVRAQEVLELVLAKGLSPHRTYHLDGGQSSKLAVAWRSEVQVVGSMHYLRWPHGPEVPFFWTGRSGRRLRAAFVVRGPKP